MSLVNPLVIPKSMVNTPQWVLWGERKVVGVPELDDKGKLVKVPYLSSSTSKKSWRSFDFVMEGYESGRFNGVGYVLHEDNVVCIDLDHCIEPDYVYADYVVDILNMFNPRGDNSVFVELSPSGDGLHIWCSGNPPVTGSKFHESIEVYGTDVNGVPSPRFVAVTGNTMYQPSYQAHKLGNRTTELAWLQQEYGILSEMTRSLESTSLTLPVFEAPHSAVPEYPNSLSLEDLEAAFAGEPQSVEEMVAAEAQEPPPRVYTNYVNAIVMGDLQQVTGASLRNNTLFKVGCNLYRVGHSDWSGRLWGELRGLLETTATDAGLPLKEVHKTLNSVEKTCFGQTRKPPKD